MSISLSTASGRARRLLIIRGDLRSRTGIAYEARAQLRLLHSDFDIVGCDIHPDPNDREAAFPYPIIGNDEVPRWIAATRQRPVVLHHVPPEDFRSFPGAWNVGNFAWETDVAPRLRQWAIKIALMDGMWAQCSMIAELIRGLGYRPPVASVAWPFDFAQARSGDARLWQGINVRLFGRLRDEGCNVSSVPLADARMTARTVFVSVQSMAARKGLPVLLREWRRHRADAAHGRDLLILRLAFRHAAGLDGSPEAHVGAMLRDAGFRPGDAARLGIIAETMSDAELGAFFQAGDAYVSTTLGEGFGGPIMEAIVNHRPVIVPRHTAMTDYIPADYPLIIASERRVVGLRGGLAVYPPAAAWHLPVPGSLAERLATFVRMPAEERAGLAGGLRRHAAGFCSVPVVRQAMQAFFRTLLAEPAARAEVA